MGPPAQKKYVGDLNINHSLQGPSMLVQCPNCDEQLDMDTAQGLSFECPSCGSDFEVGPPHSGDVEYSEHHWSLVLKSEGCYEEKLAYIQSNDGEIPDDRLITFSIYEGELNWGLVAGSIFFAGIPLVLFATIHIVSNFIRSHKLFFWRDGGIRKYYDPVEEVFITMQEFRSGWHPTNLQFIRKKNLPITEEFQYYDERQSHYKYNIPVNDEQTISFSDKNKANRFVSMVYEHR